MELSFSLADLQAGSDIEVENSYDDFEDATLYFDITVHESGKTEVSVTCDSDLEDFNGKIFFCSSFGEDLAELDFNNIGDFETTIKDASKIDKIMLNASTKDDSTEISCQLDYGIEAMIRTDVVVADYI